MAYQPAVNTTQSPGLAHLATVYYDRLGLDKLRPELRFAQVADPHPLPRNVGKTMQQYRFSDFSFNTTPASEGVVGAGLSLSSATISATVEEYNDFTSSSRLLEDTDIAPFVDEMVDEMSFRGAITNDELARIEIDSNSGALVATEGASFSAADIRANVARLKTLNIKPFSGSEFLAILHPLVVFDLQGDNTAGGFIDLLKYANPQGMVNGEVGKCGGARIVETTRVGSSGAAPNVLYYSYIFGKGGIGQYGLSGSVPGDVLDPNASRFETMVSKGGPSGFDPAGTIGTYVAYRFVVAYQTKDTTNIRFRIAQSDASLV